MALKKYHIHGMSCASCASSIEKKLNSLGFINNARVNYPLELAFVDFVTSSKENERQVLLEVSKIGFSFKEKKQDKAPQGVFALTSLLISVCLFLLNMKFILSEDLKLNWTIQFILSSIILFGVGRKFVKAIFLFLTTGRSNMNTLIGLGTVCAYLYSGLSLILLTDLSSVSVYFEAVGFIISFVYLGKYLEEKAKKKAMSALKSLMDVSVKKALLVKDNEEVEVNVDELKTGDVIRIKPGGKVPIDAKVISGQSSVDESLLTGEPLPSLKKKGDVIFAGTISTDGVLEGRVLRSIGDSKLYEIINYVENAQLEKPNIQNLADKISAVFVPTVIFLGLMTFLFWYFSFAKGDLAVALAHTISVLVIACPCALGLATPVAVVVGTGLAYKRGVLVAGGHVLEMASEVDVIIFDKTGTLTKGSPSVSEYINSHGKKDENLLLAKGLAQFSEHPLAVAISEYVLKSSSFASSFEVVPGMGIKGEVEGHRVLIGNQPLLQSEGLPLPTGGQASLTTSFLAINESVVGHFTFTDEIKDGAFELVEGLKKRGIKTQILSGDKTSVVRSIKEKLRADHFIGEVLPLDKANYVSSLKSRGHKVAMVGDGINDAPALALADISIAMGTGTDIAIAASHVSLLKGNLKLISEFLNISKFTFKIIKQNLFLSFIYNIICIPVAAGGLVVFGGPSFSPSFAGMAMALSSLSVVLNSLRINYARLS